MTFKKWIAAPVLLVAGAMAASAAGQQVIFVRHNAQPNGDGTSWETAFNSLQDALAAGRPRAGGKSVRFWIRKGVYRPDDGEGLTPLDRTLSFELYDGAVLLGGFEGNESNENERDPVANKTILSGDLLEVGPNDDDSRHLVTTCADCSGLAILDGLVIRDTNADAQPPQGGGLLIEGDLEVHIIGCLIQSNFAEKGAGIAVTDGTVLIDGCTIRDNHASVDAGGLLAEGSSVVTIIDTLFQTNESPEGEHDVVNDFGSRMFVTNSELESVWNIGTIDSGGDNTGAQLRIGGDYDQQNDFFTGVMEFDLGGTIPGVNHDQVEVTGDASLRGLAHLLLIGDYLPEGPEVFELVLAGSISNQFDAALYPDIGNDRTFRLNQGGGVLAGGGAEVEGSLEDLDVMLEFDEPVQTVIPGAPTDIALGDFNEDQFAEAALTVPDPGGVLPGDAVIVVNNGNSDGQWQGFGTVVEVEVGINPVALAIGDLDGDDVNDLVVANYDDDTVSVLINNQDLLGETPFTRTDYSTGGTGPVDVALADVVSDSFLDIIVANEGGDLTILRRTAGLAGEGGGDYIVAAVLDDPVSPGSVDPTDLDNDKDLDLVFGDAGTESVGVASNLGEGSFSVTEDIPLNGAPAGARALDLNGDGATDLVAVVPGLNGLAVILDEGTGFGPVIYVPVGREPSSLATGDFDDDGDRDLAVVVQDEFENRVVQILRNDSTPGLLAYTLGQKLGQQDGPLNIAGGDVDLDMIPDVVAGASPPPPLAGGGATGVVSTHVSEPSVVELCPADVDGSGAVDVTDLLAVLGAWGPCPAPCPPDTDSSGAVDVTDLLAVLGSWGDCP